MTDWQISDKPIDYPDAVSAMEARVAAIRAGSAPELVWLLEHPPLYTKGTSAKPGDLLPGAPSPGFETGRGGEYTYHGPGQRIAYTMLDLKQRYAPAVPDLRDFVKKLESWIIATLAEFGIESFTREGRIGVWVENKVTGVWSMGAGNLPNSQLQTPNSESKIAALGIRVRQGVSYHGISINLNPDLSHYRGIVPCGIREFGVTSLAELGLEATMPELDAALKRSFSRLF